jgi:hypothetical protein
MESLPQPGENAGKIVFFLMEQETHEIGLLLGAYLAKDLGWKVYYLGQNVPSEDIAMTVELLEPDLLMTMFVAARNNKNDEVLCRLLASRNIPLLFSGNLAYLPCKTASAYHIPVQNPNEFIAFLQEFRENTTRIQE